MDALISYGLTKGFKFGLGLLNRKESMPDIINLVLSMAGEAVDHSKNPTIFTFLNQYNV